jgi:hypothetical protein
MEEGMVTKEDIKWILFNISDSPLCQNTKFILAIYNFRLVEIVQYHYHGGDASGAVWRCG